MSDLTEHVENNFTSFGAALSAGVDLDWGQGSDRDAGLTLRELVTSPGSWQHAEPQQKTLSRASAPRALVNRRTRLGTGQQGSGAGSLPTRTSCMSLTPIFLLMTWGFITAFRGCQVKIYKKSKKAPKTSLVFQQLRIPPADAGDMGSIPGPGGSHKPRGI